MSNVLPEGFAILDVNAGAPLAGPAFPGVHVLVDIVLPPVSYTHLTLPTKA